MYKLTLTITGAASGDSGAAGYCWTTSGLTTLNSAKANAIMWRNCRYQLLMEQLILIWNVLMMHAHTLELTILVMVSIQQTTGEIPGTDWQYVDGVTSEFRALTLVA